MAKITYSTKTDNQTSILSAINKVSAEDINQIKENFLITLISHF
jgi:hypothetical protein